MKKRGLYLILAVILALSFTSCSISSAKEQPDHEKAEKTAAPAAEQTFQTSDGQFSITADDSWKQAGEELNIQDASLALSKRGEGYIALISEERWNFPIDLAEYNRMAVKQIRDHVDQDETGQSEAISLGNYEAFRTTITGIVEGSSQAYWLYCLQAGDSYIQLVFWCNGEGQEAFGEEFDRIAGSLQQSETDMGSDEKAEGETWEQ